MKVILTNIKIFLEGLAIGLIASFIGRDAIYIASALLLLLFVATAMSLTYLKEKTSWNSYIIGVLLTSAGFNVGIVIHTIYRYFSLA